MADDYSQFTGKPEGKDQSDSTLGQYAGVAARGLVESVPFKGEQWAEKMNLPKPTTLGQRSVERAARNLPYTAPLMAVNPLLGGATLLGGTVGGQTAEELGGGPLTQAAGEIVGGGLPGALRSMSGRMFGYIDPMLKNLSSKAKAAGYEVGPGARSRTGMSYGSGETAEAMERNLTKATQEATKRAGAPANAIDATWINKTQKSLGDKVDSLFKGKTFVSDTADVNSINKVLSDVKQAFGDQSSSIESIITNNIKGTRPGGPIVKEIKTQGITIPANSQFSAEGLRNAIMEVNSKLGSGQNAPQNQLLYKLKDSLENIAEKNLKATDPKLVKEYQDWKANYNSFATLRDLFERAGKAGVDQQGKINVQTLEDLIATRNGSAANAVNHPLHPELGEFGGVLRTAKVPSVSGVTGAVKRTLKESPIPKAFIGAVQPSVSSRNQDLYNALGIYAPVLSKSTQMTPSDKQDPYAQFTGAK